MTWVKLDDNFPEHDKVIGLSDRGFRLHVAALCYCARNLTDGVLTVTQTRIVGAIIGTTNPRRWIAELVDAGLWLETEDGDGFEIKDFLDYNPAAVDVKERRTSNARRQALFRNRDLRDGIRERDQDRCRYCGVEVRWTDRKGLHGGTYDHIDPNGDNTPLNVVVSCRSCNSRKAHRTPDEAGMTLLLPPSSHVTKLDLVTDQVSGRTPSRPVPSPKNKSRAVTSSRPEDEQPGNGTAPVFKIPEKLVRDVPA